MKKIGNHSGPPVSYPKSATLEITNDTRYIAMLWSVSHL